MIEKYVNDYLNYIVNINERSKKRTADKYKLCLNEFLSYMNVQSIDDIKNIGYMDIRSNWLSKKKEEGLGSQSLNLRIVAIKSFLGYLHNIMIDGKPLIERNVAENLKRYSVKTKEKSCDKDELYSLINTAKGEFHSNPNYLTCRNYFMMCMLITTGLRNEEIRSLKKEDIDNNDEFIIIGKRSKMRELSINKDILKLYKQYLWYRNSIGYDNPYLFVSKTGKMMDKNAIGNMFKKYLKLANIDDSITPHDMRHAAASILLDDGASIYEVAQLLGHKNINTTYSFYSHIIKGNTKDIINKNTFIKEIM